ncbi:xanthine dehydrogenase family protein molybdopterin-binding subunit [Sphingomonas ginkgonis]|uniref:Xanthine dehydrogenase family protein molybdopterin-binding subunit n=2 Tax=Sphingomonas ginkgonis TaxID=2315330 RepID=A0A3R9WSK5_9SPHN|nr:xanthine dehydrogenase family protein molybdopterin-binding subunit [Sphingomonas ginkgonis]
MTLAPKDSGRAAIGEPTSRIDGRLKVTGAARYGSDLHGGANPAFAYLRTSSIARGRISRIDESEARQVPGVLEILTYRNVGDRVKPGKTFSEKGYMGTSIAPLASDKVWHDGQIVALVVADTFEAARDAAHRLRIDYAEEAPSATFGSAGLTEGKATEKTEAQQQAAKQQAGGKSKEGENGGEENPKVGDAEGAFARAAVKVDQHYETPTQHHNPIELFTTSAVWNGDRLTVFESSQNMWGFKYGLAEQLGIPADNVHTVSPLVGGAFGSRGSLTQRTALVALAAKMIGRPVHLEATRSDGFTIATYRAETRHRVRLGAGADGRLQALIHEGWEVSSRPDDYKVAGIDASTRLYACPNVASNVTIVHADRNTPGFMRSPPETPYLFALESAIDELAYALKMDPVELRRINDTQKEPIKGLPYTSRHLMPCFDAAAAAFGWSRRSAAPRSMRDGEWLIGWGCASTMYPTQVGSAAARVSLLPSGRARVETATHEIGTGVMTALALTAAEELGLPLDKIDVIVGDSNLPPAPVAGGSNSTASMCNVVAKACREVRLKAQSAGGGAVEALASNNPHGAPPNGVEMLYRGKPSLAGGAKLKDRIQFAFGAHFIEVRVHERTREVRAPRVVSAFAAGRIVNPKTAKSQLMGGQIWGIGAALHEATDIDRRAARYYNNDLAEYLIPVNADIGTIETIILPEEDRQVNDLGIKGIGELGNVGLNAATANAVFHATGVRIRELPIRIEKLLV